MTDWSLSMESLSAIRDGKIECSRCDGKGKVRKSY